MICLFNKRMSYNQITIAFLYYASTIACASLFIGTIPAWGIHALYALIAAPFIFISSISGAVSIATYSIFNLVVAFDYIFYPLTGTMISNNFISSQLYLRVKMMIIESLTVLWIGWVIIRTFIEVYRKWKNLNDKANVRNDK